MDNESILLLQISNFAVKKSLPSALKGIFTKLDLGDDEIALNIIKYLCEVINNKKKLPWPVVDDRTLRFFVRELHKFMAETRVECPGFTFPGVSLSSFLNKEQRKTFIFEFSTSAFELTHALPREPQGVLKKCKYSSKNKIVASAVSIVEDNKEDNAKLLQLKNEEKELDVRLKKAEEILKKRFSISNDIPNVIDEVHQTITAKINELQIFVAEKNDLMNAYNSLGQPVTDLNKLKFKESDLHGFNRSTMFKAQLRFYNNNRNVAGALEKISDALEAMKVSNGPESNIIIEKELENLFDLKDYKEIENAVKCQLKFLKQKCFKDQEKVQEVLPHRDKFEVTYLHDASNFGLEPITPDDTISTFTINNKDFLSDLSPSGSSDSEIFLSDSSNITFRNKSSFLRSKMSISTSSPLAVDLAKKKHRARFSERQPRFSEPLTELGDASHLSPVASSSYRNTDREESFDILDETNDSFTALRKSIFEWNSDDEFVEADADNSVFDESIFLAKDEVESPPIENLLEIPPIEREPGSPGFARQAAIEKYRRYLQKKNKEVNKDVEYKL